MPERYLEHDGWMEELNDEAAETAEREVSKPHSRPDGMATGVAVGGQVTIRWIVRFPSNCWVLT